MTDTTTTTRSFVLVQSLDRSTPYYGVADTRPSEPTRVAWFGTGREYAERWAGYLNTDPTRTVELGWDSPDARPYEVVEPEPTPAPVDGEVDWATSHETPAESPEVADLKRRVASLTERLATAQEPITDVSDERLTPIWDRAAEKATEEGFCPEYERITEALGIPGRERSYRGVVTIQFNVYAYATARGPEEAGEAMKASVREQLRESAIGSGDYGNDGDTTHLDFEDVEVEDVNPY